MTTTNGHVEGNNKYPQCNIAEDHALNHPGHSVTVIQDLRTEDGETFTVLVVACMGSPVIFMQDGDERDCGFVEEMRLS
jgi:hypothetical protein